MQKQRRSTKKAKPHKRRLKRKKKGSHASLDKLIEQLSIKDCLVNPSAAIKGNMPAHHDSAEIFALSAKDMDPFRSACEQSNVGCNASPFLKEAFNGAVRNRATLWQLAQKLSAPPMPMASAKVTLDISRASVRQVSRTWPLPAHNNTLKEMPKSTPHFHLPRLVAQKTARLHSYCMWPTQIQEKFSLDLSTTKKLPEQIPNHSNSIPKLSWHPITPPELIRQTYLPVNTFTISYGPRTKTTSLSRAENAQAPVVSTVLSQGNAEDTTLQAFKVNLDRDVNKPFLTKNIKQTKFVLELEEDEGYDSKGGNEDYSTSETSTDLDYLVEVMSTFSEQLGGEKYTAGLRYSASCPSLHLLSPIAGEYF